MHTQFERYLAENDDLTVVKVIDQDLGVPVICVMKNEIDSIEFFLDHYRKLGVKAFYILDDQSNDGTREYLLNQTDVCILASKKRYGEIHSRQETGLEEPSQPLRQIHLWRTQLVRRFAMEQWAIVCDADEFLELPTGAVLSDVTESLDQQGKQVAWGGMIDLYPETINDLSEKKHEEINWNFDCTKHFSLSETRSPRHHYMGARYRLECLAGISPPIKWTRSIKLRWAGKKSSPSGRLIKPIIYKSKPGDFFTTSHNIAGSSYSTKTFLPISHYYYNIGIFNKLKWVFDEGGYNKNNQAYEKLEAVVMNLKNRKNPLLCKKSKRYDGYTGYSRVGNFSL